jgi:hypothetical protein
MRACAASLHVHTSTRLQVSFTAAQGNTAYAFETQIPYRLFFASLPGSVPWSNASASRMLTATVLPGSPSAMVDFPRLPQFQQDNAPFPVGCFIMADVETTLHVDAVVKVGIGSCFATRPPCSSKSSPGALLGPPVVNANQWMAHEVHCRIASRCNIMLLPLYTNDNERK